ncbi:hypothetical protein CI238_12651, partial [Colletotrichum incanum]
LETRRGDHEEAGTEVEGHGHLPEDLELRRGDVDVAHRLARGDGLSGEADELARPGAGSDDDEVRRENLAVVERRASDCCAVGAVVQADRGAGHKVDAVEGLDLGGEVRHCGAGISPAREGVDVAPCPRRDRRAEEVLDGGGRGQLLDDLVAVLARQGDDVVVALADVFEGRLLGLLLGLGVGVHCLRRGGGGRGGGGRGVGGGGCRGRVRDEAEAGLAVAALGAEVRGVLGLAPFGLGLGSEAGVGRVGVVCADDAGGVDGGGVLAGAGDGRAVKDGDGCGCVARALGELVRCCEAKDAGADN